MPPGSMFFPPVRAPPGASWTSTAGPDPVLRCGVGMRRGRSEGKVRGACSHTGQTPAPASPQPNRGRTWSPPGLGPPGHPSPSAAGQERAGETQAEGNSPRHWGLAGIWGVRGSAQTPAARGRPGQGLATPLMHRSFSSFPWAADLVLPMPWAWWQQLCILPGVSSCGPCPPSGSGAGGPLGTSGSSLGAGYMGKEGANPHPGHGKGTRMDPAHASNRALAFLQPLWVTRTPQHPLTAPVNGRNWCEPSPSLL